MLGRFLAILLPLGFTLPAGAQNDYLRAPIQYQDRPVADPVHQLREAIEAGTLELAYHEKYGYLPAVLKALEVPVSSQVLVFSKTSLQLRRISPRHPRAIYFNDNVYVGYCWQGDVLELAASDAQQGAIFYTLKQEADSAPKLLRDRGNCLSCHVSARTQSVPGYLVRSVYPDSNGRPRLGRGTFLGDTTHPFKERWGGWYVTGTHGDMRHMGNTISRGKEQNFEREDGANLVSLKDQFVTDQYLSPHSDLVALMVLEHQSQMHNAIAAANYETRRALHQSFEMNEILDRPEGYLSDSANRRIDAAADRVLRHLLFCDEFQLTDRVAGTSRFQAEFTARGLRDSAGRSLRDFDLATRTFRYPCSYLIHSDAFAGLPEEVRSLVLERLRAILEGRDLSAEYAHLDAPTRKAIREILVDTLPAYSALVR